MRPGRRVQEQQVWAEREGERAGGCGASRRPCEAGGAPRGRQEGAPAHGAAQSSAESAEQCRVQAGGPGQQQQQGVKNQRSARES